jgi:hypothetical protein
MKKTYKALKFLALGLFAIAVTGCSTSGHKSEEVWQGKVWRGPVVTTFVNTSSNPTDKDFIAKTKFDAIRDAGLRMSRVHISTGWSSVMANTIVPDNLEFSQLPKGTLVDVMAELGTNTDHSKQRYTRILRIVCAKADEKCIEGEKSAKRYQAIVEQNPAGDISAQYGVSYNRRVTKEELAKYD